MKKIYLIFWITIFLFATNAQARERTQPLKLIQKITLSDVKGRVDHLAVDLEGERLFIAALGNNTLEVIDLHSGKRIKSIAGLRYPQGVLFIPEFNKIYVTNSGNGECDVFDADSFQLLNRIRLSADADNIHYDPKRKLIYIGYARDLGVVDAATDTVVATVRLSAHPESFAWEEPGNRIFVNIPAARLIAVVDRNMLKIVDSWACPTATENFAMALDQRQHRLFVSFRKPGLFAVFDTVTSKEIAQAYIPADCDDIFYDPQHRRVYLSCGEGFIVVFKQAGPNRYVRQAKIFTRPGARTCLFVPEENKLYVAAPRYSTVPAQILVYAIQ